MTASPQQAHLPSLSYPTIKRYKVSKLLSCGDFICHDDADNHYLLVCGAKDRGYEYFRKLHFHRTSNNRCLLTPVQDVQNQSITYTVYMLPRNAKNIQELGHKFTSEIYCLNILYSLVSKVVKCLIEMFGTEAEQWLHIDNIWVKEGKIFYILNMRKVQPLNHINFHRNRVVNINDRLSIPKSQKSTQLIVSKEFQKRILRKLCTFLSGLFRIDPELQSLQSIIMDAILNQELTNQEVCFLLRDKRKRKSFIQEREQNKSIQNIDFTQIKDLNTNFWKKKQFVNFDLNRRGLKAKTINVQSLNSRQLNQSEYQNTQSRRRYNVSGSKLFNFSLSRKNKSISLDKTITKYQRSPQKTKFSDSFQQKMFSQIKSLKASRRYSISVNIQQRALNRYKQFEHESTKRESIMSSIDQQDKRLKQFLNSKSKNKKNNEIGLKQKNYNTIDISVGQNFSFGIQKSKNLLQNSAKKALINIYHQSQNKNNHFEQKAVEINKNIQPSVEVIQQKVRFGTSQSDFNEKQQEKKAKDTNQEKIDIKRSYSNKDFKKQEHRQSLPNSLYDHVEQTNFEKVQIPHVKFRLQNEDKNKVEVKESLQNQAMPTLPFPKEKKVKTEKNYVNGKSQEQDLEQIVLDNNENRKLSTKQQENKKNVKETAIQKTLKNQTSNNNQISDKDEVESAKRTKTVASEIASSCSSKKSVSKQVNEYLHMLNRMGESVAKSSRISAKLQGIQWFVGIYFIYKRFLYERKKVEGWLQKKQPNLTRYSQKNMTEWSNWFNSEQKKNLQQKIKLQNENIISSILKMNKKLMKKNLSTSFQFHAALNRHSQQQSKIAVSEVVKQFDLLDEKQKLQDQQILIHINQLMNSLYIIAQLDGKILQKKQLMQMFKKKNPQELQEFADYIYQLYIKQ